jgi:signal transduction histidine kinase
MAHTQSIEPFDSRLALRLYASLIGLGGVTLAVSAALSPGSTLADVPWPGRAPIQMGGAVMVAAALCGLGLASVDVLTRRRLLTWFLAAHVVVWLVLEMQFLTTPAADSLPLQASWVMLTAAVCVLALLVPSDPRRRRGPLSVVDAPAADQVTSSGALYEQQIRAAAAQEERNRLARDLHDAVKQQIFAIQTSAATAEARFESDRAGAREALAQVRQSAREAMTEMEALLSQLRVAPLGNTGLVEAIRKHGEALAFRTGADVVVEVAPWPHEDALPPGAHDAIFRIVQEALANVGRHARAKQVRVSLDASSQRVEVRVRDDGTGFDQQDGSQGMGLHNMRARAAGIGGSMEVRRAEGGGTLVTLSVPFETDDARRWARRQAMLGAVGFGVTSLLLLMNLYLAGFDRGNAFTAMGLGVLCVSNLRTWLRLRTAAEASATSMEHRS